jgi:Mn-dependent DtxR family transcriptional regulator
MTRGGWRNRPYTETEIEAVIDGYENEMPLKVIAEQIGRSPRSVQVRLFYLRKDGLVGIRPKKGMKYTRQLKSCLSDFLGDAPR